jgi:hypothetical protein
MIAAAPPSRILRFLRGGAPGHAEGPHPDSPHHTHPWYLVLWLTGVDYFSTLGYQPGIAFLAAGVLSPLATGILVLVTLLGALPVYAQVARRSYIGQGSIAMLEHLLPGWRSKLFVLTLLGFAATDFVITMTLSAADAAQHAVENPLLHHVLGDHKITVTIVFLALLAAVFLRGFKEAIGLAVLVGVPYILLTLLVVLRAGVEVARHPEVLSAWHGALTLRGTGPGLVLASILVFPKLALGMSGFETGVSVMPLIRGGSGDPDQGGPPAGRIRATRKLLLSAALLMSGMLLLSSLVTTLLIPAAEFAPGGKANGRALAYLAHRHLGEILGSVYDISTIVILWFAGASAMAGLLNLVPRYLPRFGMAPRWLEYPRALVLLLFVIDLIVTLVFRADVDAQGGAYATGVLVLMLSAAVAVALAFRGEAREAAGQVRRHRLWASAYFWIIAAVFAFTLVDNVIERPDGVIIASVFILLIMIGSAASRWRRATELRVEELTFVDPGSKALWRTIIGKKVNLVPIGHLSRRNREAKARFIRRHYRTEGPLAYLQVRLRDDRSEFISPLRVRIEREAEGDYIINVTGAVSVANAIAYISEQIDPIAIFLSLTRENPLTQALAFVLWGQGEIGILVYEILIRYWAETPEEDVRPLIFLISD